MKYFDLEEIAQKYSEKVNSEFGQNGRQSIIYDGYDFVKDDFIAGALEMKNKVLKILKENQSACSDLCESDRQRSAQDIVNETYEDLVSIIESLN